MSKSLIKASQVVLKEEEVCIIDSNQLVAEKMQEMNSRFPQEDEQGFRSGLDAVQLEVVPDEGEAEGNLAQEPVYAEPSLEELVAEAQIQIEEMRAKAEEELASMREYTLEEWRKQGFDEGQKKAIEALEKEKLVLKQKAEILEGEYQKKVDQLEVEFIEVLTGIYEQIFKVDLVDYRPILVHAISNSIRNIEGGRNFIVHVSKQDYEEVIKAKEEIFSRMASTSATLEIIEDITLGANECMIETSNGIYDCGIGSQLEELTRRLRLLSYER